jgi:DNA-binding PadR family transcriptional regulator
MNVAGRRARGLSRSEAAVLALLALEGERSGYDLLRDGRRGSGFAVAPAKSGLYALLPRLVRDGLASGHTVAQAGRPDKELYAVTAAGRAALDEWLTAVVPGDEDGFRLKLFAGELTNPTVVRRHVEQFRDDAREQLGELERRDGGGGYRGLLLDLAAGRARHALAWAEDALAGPLR